jgi:hypothetical protein
MKICKEMSIYMWFNAIDIEMLTGLINDTSNINQKVFVGEGITNVKVWSR